jgi:oligoendopeptidase F
MQNQKDTLNNTIWDNSQIYSSFTDSSLINDVENLKGSVRELKESCEVFTSWIEELEKQKSVNDSALELSRSLKRKEMDLSVVLRTLSTFAQCTLSTDSQNTEATELASKISIIGNDLSKATKPLHIFLNRAPESFIENFLNNEEVSEISFLLHHERKFSDHLLKTSEEILASGLSQDGLHAWGKLYNSISGKMKVNINGEETGLAKASGLLRGSDAALRKEAFEGISKAWVAQEESAAAILNSINGWRLEMNQARSTKKELHYLDVSCQQSRISRRTLDTLMETTYEKRNVGQKALKLMAQLMKKDKLDPWDILAPAPMKSSENAIAFDKAIDLIANAFSKLTPEMGDFARMMADRNWIDSMPTDNRSPGAYCTKFANVREPRVFMTYTGSMGNVVTLAHELGHAYHNWVMKDLPYSKTHYSMTLAETASIFAETLVKRDLLSLAETKEDKLNILWQDAESAAALMINIPARYEFEKSLVEARKIKPQTPSELKEMMSESWEKWYGDTLTSYDPMFWANKLHFSISGLGFYNYPYLFGYLFSLGIYGQKDKFGEKFNGLYNEILKDTGSMMAEDLIQKHLGQDIEKAGFWLYSRLIKTY